MKKYTHYIYNIALLLLLGAATTANAQTIKGNIYGGGQLATVTLNTEVKINSGTVDGDVYGGGALANVEGNTEVWLSGGSVMMDIYGGGLGDANTAALVLGDATVTLNGSTESGVTNDCKVYGSIFACNNVNGTPKGHAKVHVLKTTPRDGQTSGQYDVAAVYGGGNLAAYEPTNVNEFAEVLIENCDNSIEYVYGGGNAAPVPATQVTIYGANAIDNAFAGGNGAGQSTDPSAPNYNPGADIGYLGYYISGTATEYGTGIATINVQGGTIHHVYGGSNTLGYIRDHAEVNVNDAGTCTMDVAELYGGGKMAPGKAAQINITCTGEGKIDNVYGGAHMADLTGDITLNINGGNIGNAFGGNNVSGNINGAITVNVNWDAEACGTNSLNNVYGGGNQANYANATTVNMKNGTVNHIYGGGNEAGVGSATVNMLGGDVLQGLYGGCNTSGTVTGDIAVNVTGGQVGTDAEHKANVHGGGYGSATQTAGNVAVAVNGDAVVVYGDIYGGSALGNVNDNTDDNTTVTITAGTVNGDVYGGGLGDASNAALVNGNVAVNINGGTVTGNVFGCNNVNGTPKGSVAVTVAEDANATLAEVYGGGNMATYAPTTAQAPVVTILGCDNTIGYVYGGGNAADVPATNVTVWGGTIDNVFGGGHGDKDADPATAANVTGNVTVNIKGGTITNVFAGSNSKGNIGGTVALTIDKDGDCPMHITDVYGGGNQAAGNAGTVTIGCTGGADEGIQNVYGGANAADINSDIALVITGGTINNVFGGNNTSGNISGTIDVTVDWNGSCTTNHINNVYGAGNKAPYTGSPTVKIFNGEVSQNVFGGGLGATAIVTGNPVVTIGDATAPAKVATVGGDVYGGGDAAAVVGTTLVNVIAKENTTINNVYGGGNAADVKGTDVNIDGGKITGMVFGGGHGNAGSSIAANVNGNVAVDVTGGTINKVFGGSNDMGNISGTVNVNIDKGDDSNEMHITEVYGGGNVAAGNAGTVTIGCTGGDTEGIGTVYGGANNADVGNNIVLNISGGSIDNVFGGNNNGGAVDGSITVNVNWTGTCGTNKLGNVYGAGNIAEYTGNPTVNIINTTMTGSVFGGGKGKPAVVVGNPTVNIGSWTEGAVSIGGNVFGGGDLAAVEGAPTVTIRDCDTYIGGDLYGGGNAAPVYETKTTVWGGTIAGNLFGGGNGVDLSSNAKGAQVGYTRDDTTQGGTGNANTHLYGGTIGVWNGNTCESGGGVFGGSNSNGNIRGDVNLNVDEQACTEPNATQCDLKIREVYGAGNEAAFEGTGIYFNIGCVSYLEEIYGGAKAADLNGDAVLTIRSGHFKKVFGGNKVSGKLNGKIEVNIDETGCNPVVIEELYGGGNLAAYSVYGYVDELIDDVTVTRPRTKDEYDALTDVQKANLGLTTPRDNPLVNIVSCTRIDNIYGGGYGAPATMVGNPTVNINQILGDHAAAIGGKLGTIGTVYGGGNEAKVVGNTNVNVGTIAQNAHIQNAEGTIDTTPTAAGANITGNVYGGGNAADVTGKTNVTIGRGN